MGIKIEQAQRLSRLALERDSAYLDELVRTADELFKAIGRAEGDTTFFEVDPGCTLWNALSIRRFEWQNRRAELEANPPMVEGLDIKNVLSR